MSTTTGTSAGTSSTTTSESGGTAPTTQVYKIYIKASAQRIWDAITQPDWNSRFGYGGRGSFDLRPGGRYEALASEEFKAAAAAAGQPCGDVVVDGEVVEADEPHRLVLNWRMLMDPEIAAEGFTRLTYEIKQWDGFCSLTVVHELENAPKLALIVGGAFEGEGAGGGHAWILSDLKSLLETGGSLAAPRIT